MCVLHALPSVGAGKSGMRCIAPLKGLIKLSDRNLRGQLAWCDIPACLAKFTSLSHS